ncbi:hypothetical protein CH54_2870 [Yersinia rochesterensis]|uniref:Uncharacterized protein n=1 Tax=Yersinia rochesterensis TaxID=1604335 RepID=A0ABM5SQ53_9GAMM|nr:hypothetical protein DJ57_3687 [Yersinia rochesterensis]AJI87701.1 hypothetical protein AW19_2919 [Yersinia frederiksenii Y225]AJJ36719.1 hypothetical protein CH54_2870 [Yersinia rochesterensis]
MVVGEGLFVTSFLTLRVAASRRCLATLGSNLIEGFHLPLKCLTEFLILNQLSTQG